MLGQFDALNRYLWIGKLFGKAGSAATIDGQAVGTAWSDDVDQIPLSQDLSQAKRFQDDI